MSPPGICSVSLWTHVNFSHLQQCSCDFGSEFCWFTAQPSLFPCFVLYLLICFKFMLCPLILVLEVTANRRSLSDLLPLGHLCFRRPVISLRSSLLQAEKCCYNHLFLTQKPSQTFGYHCCPSLHFFWFDSIFAEMRGPELRELTVK